MRYAFVVMLLIGCYEPPDYSGTHFKCDGEHECPAGQQCMNGTCGGGGSGMPDAPSSASGVKCGATTCGATQKCCSDAVGGGSCIPLATTCAGGAATCDGVEDCAGQACCDNGGGVIGCAATCTQKICQEDADCAGMCCAHITQEPWGRCLAVCP